MVVVSGPVLNVPVELDPPPPEDVHESLLADVQLMAVLALYGIEVDVAKMDTLGAVVVDPPPPPLPHEARPETAKNTAKKTLRRTLELIVLFVIFVSLNNGTQSVLCQAFMR